MPVSICVLERSVPLTPKVTNSCSKTMTLQHKEGTIVTENHQAHIGVFPIFVTRDVNVHVPVDFLTITHLVFRIYGGKDIMASASLIQRHWL